MENVKLSAALLSRFDLVFVVRDEPDELMDAHLSEHVMAVSLFFRVQSACPAVDQEELLLPKDVSHGVTRLPGHCQGAVHLRNGSTGLKTTATNMQV